MIRNDDGVMWIDGEWLHGDKPVLPMTARSVLYGAGCFETMCAYHSRLLHPDRHLERLRGGIEWLGGVYANYSTMQITDVARELLDRNNLNEKKAMLRIQASLLGNRGYEREPLSPVRLAMQVAPAPSSTQAVRLTQVSVCVVPDRCRPSRFKLSNTLHYMEAWRQANSRGYDDAIMETIDGVVAETSVSNLFWKKGNTIYTPSLECDILPGQMRRIVLEELPVWSGLQIEQGRYRIEDLVSADLVWTTNALRQIRPVSQIDSVAYPTEDEFYQTINKMLDIYVLEYSQ